MALDIGKLPPRYRLPKSLKLGGLFILVSELIRNLKLSQGQKKSKCQCISVDTIINSAPKRCDCK
jgi:hypothetical protein